MKIIRLAGIGFSIAIMLSLVIFYFFAIENANGAIWIETVIFFMFSIPSIISLRFLIWVKPIDNLHEISLLKRSGGEILDFPQKDFSKEIAKLKDLKYFDPIKVWVIISVIMYLLLAKLIAGTLLQSFNNDTILANFRSLLIIFIDFCLFALCLVDIFILANIHFRKEFDKFSHMEEFK